MNGQMAGNNLRSADEIKAFVAQVQPPRVWPRIPAAFLPPLKISCLVLTSLIYDTYMGVCVYMASKGPTQFPFSPHLRFRRECPSRPEYWSGVTDPRFSDYVLGSRVKP